MNLGGQECISQKPGPRGRQCYKMQGRKGTLCGFLPGDGMDFIQHAKAVKIVELGRDSFICFRYHARDQETEGWRPIRRLLSYSKQKALGALTEGT